ncbi:uncharacterized protein LOC123535818 [Mercenaria mercenaria]|uniref:uncharacterized protein LOC123535818 n=1 Tax=Mercenaria mercenaria TaxID=6596 RepID=UPI00234FA3DB|nr:uncharacterized protein LOC123535818 [Mercenaria mercenaria]
MAVSGRKVSDFRASVSEGTTEDFDYSCEPCLAIGQYIEAHGFCVDCQEYMCKNCFAYHQRMKATKHHNLLDIDSIDKHTIDSTDSAVCTEKCHIHKNEIIKFFCTNHEFLGCTDCITLNHRTCKTDYIPDKCAGIGDSNECRETMRALDRKIEEMDALLKKATLQDNEVDSSYDHVIKEITKFRKEINDRLDQLQKQIQTEADKKKFTDKRTVKNVIETCTATSSDIMKFKSSIQDSKTSQQNGQLYILIKQAKSKLKLDDLKNAEESLDQTSIQYTFKRNKQLENLLTKKDIFGKLNLSTTLMEKEQLILSTTLMEKRQLNLSTTQVKKEQMNISSTLMETEQLGVSTTLMEKEQLSLSTTLMDKEQLDLSTTLMKEQLSLSTTLVTPRKKKVYTKLTDIGNINVSIKSDETTCRCSITGCAVLFSHRVMLADYNNQKLKVVDKQSKAVIQEKTFDSVPYDVAVLPQNQIAVTMPDKKEILIMTKTGKLSISRSIPVKQQCRGITYHQGQLYVVCRDPNSVHIVDTQGNVNNIISLNNEIFATPNYILLSEDAGHIYISDCDSNSVVSVTLHGDISAVYKHNDLVAPLGMLMLDDGSFLVCCFNNDTIHHISRNLKRGETVLNSGLENPQSICYNHREQEVRFAYNRSIAGVMSMDQDDFLEHYCNAERFPLLTAIYNAKEELSSKDNHVVGDVSTSTTQYRPPKDVPFGIVVG